MTSGYSTCAVRGDGDNADNIGGIAGYVFHESSVIHCAALNTAVTGKGANIGRVVGDIPNINTVLLSNVAYAKMQTDADNTAKALPAKDGVDITTVKIATDGTIGGRFTNSTEKKRERKGWKIKNGRLPGLGGATVELPNHLQSPM